MHKFQFGERPNEMNMDEKKEKRHEQTDTQTHRERMVKKKQTEARITSEFSVALHVIDNKCGRHKTDRPTVRSFHPSLRAY